MKSSSANTVVAGRIAAAFRHVLASAKSDGLPWLVVVASSPELFSLWRDYLKSRSNV